MKLYYAPGACSLGIHVLLEEIGKPYEAAPVNLREGAQYKPDFVAINPKSKVPTLERDDGSVLTEFPAIAYWLAAHQPGREAAAGGRRRPGARAGGDGLRRGDDAHAGLHAHVPADQLRAERSRRGSGEGARPRDRREGPSR